VKTITVKTDQNIEIELELASLAQRFAAVVLDVVILVVYFALMTFIIAMVFLNSYDYYNQEANSEDFWLAVFYIIVYLPFLLYTPLMEYLTKGQTIGKLALGIRVVKATGDNATFKDYFTRWLFRPVEFYILNFFGIGFFLALINGFFDALFALISGRSQRIGGFMSNTIVVRKNPLRDYSIKDVLSIKTNENHVATYPGVTKFTDDDMMLIKRTIGRVESFQNTETKLFAVELANKTAEELGLQETPPKKLTFLKTVLDDYVVLTR
jgi:uncharacterized RDD family membrane protein YckC